MIKGRLSKGAVFVVLLAIFLGGITKAETSSVTDIKQLFGMSCEMTRIPAIGKPIKMTFDPSQYTQELELLTKKGYNRIDMIKEFVYNGQPIKILLGEKCDLPVLRINQQESVNDIGVDHIEKRNNKLLMYGSKDGFATLISCDLGTLIGNSYIPFDLPKQKLESENNSDQVAQIDTNIVTKNTNISSKQTFYQPKLLPPLKLENKIIHPQDALYLLGKPVSELITFFDGNWKRDKKELAEILNITNYRGTKEQNIQIRNYLLSYITIQFEAIETPEIELSVKEYQLIQQKVVSDIVKMRGYIRKYDRRALFQEIGEDISFYEGTRAQNLKIREFLLKKIKTKPKN
ncbi:MAG: hypothetical protein PHR61_00765 [Candidatus Absconditabacteria bacterium]|nr:hypothetical protein [Candidatus Absconditabacteria bacterium]